MRRRGDAPVLQSETETNPLRALASRLSAARASAVHVLAPLVASGSEWAKARRISLSLAHIRGVVTMVAVCCAMLSIGASSSPSAPDPGPSIAMPAPTVTLYPTPTETLLLPQPRNAPMGWQIYRAHHFAVAYPPGWVSVEHVAHGNDGEVTEVSVSFNSDDGHYAVGIAEREGLDAAALQQYCASPGTHTTFAGLPMIATTTSGTLHMYIFVSAGGVAYTLLSQASETSPDITFLDDTILGTFRAEVLTSACG